MLTAMYVVMPVGKLLLKHALIGGIAAALIWEIIRYILVWCFSTLSVVSVVYGSLTTVIVASLSPKRMETLALQILQQVDR